jgi:hypothetical protein
MWAEPVDKVASVVYVDAGKRDHHVSVVGE